MDMGFKMKNKIAIAKQYFLYHGSSFSTVLQAQQFVDKAVIEYEVNTNLKKTMSNDSWDEMIKDNLSDLKISYFTLSFADNKKHSNLTAGAQKLEFKIPKDADEENSWYFDFNWKNEYAKTNSRN
jgi:hypothetical protein